MAAAKRKAEPWDQQKGEPDNAYAAFLTYRNLGPARSIRAAYAVHQGNQTQQLAPPPGNWTEWSSEHRWPNRASAWDVAMLERHGEDVAIAFINLLRGIALKGLEALADPEMRPGSWSQVLETMGTLKEFISGDSIASIRQQGRLDDPTADV